MNHNLVVGLAVPTLRGASGGGLGDVGQLAASGHHIAGFRTPYIKYKERIDDASC